MATCFKFTAAQRNILKAIADGAIITKHGYGYHMRDASGAYIGKASIAVKSLAKMWLVAKAGDKIYFTTRGYSAWFGGMPAGERAELCKQADERVAFVQSMMDENEIQEAPVVAPLPKPEYIGLPDFWQALDAWLWAAQFGQMQRMWAGMRLHSERVKAANQRTVEQMKAVDCSRFTVDNSADDDERFERRRLWREWKGEK